MPSEASRPVRTVLESKSATPMHDTRTMMIKPTALLLPALFFFPHAYAPAADLSENKAAGFALFKSKSPDTESVKLKPKFPVRIDTQDSEIKDMVEEHLPLITQQQEEVLDKEQTGFLAEEAPDNVKTMLRSKGYFSSKVSLTEKDGAYTVHITPGAPKSPTSASPSSATSFQTATSPNTTATRWKTGSSR